MLLCFGFLLTAAPRSYASEPKDSLESLRLRLNNINVLVRKLEDELLNYKNLSAQSTRQADELQAELVTLREELQTLQASYDNSESQVAALQASLTKSEQKLKELSAIWSASLESWKAATNAERARVRRGRLWTVAIGVGAFLAGGFVGYLAGK